MNLRTALSLASAAGLAVYMGAVRPRMKNWGANPDEVSKPLPGDELVSGAHGPSTMAATIEAPPSRVWPWLVQMGCDRAGFYSWDRLDNGGRPSAENVHPEWQDLEQGGRITSTPDGKLWFDVATLERERALVLRASIDMRTSRSFDPTGRMPRAWIDGVWTFFLERRESGTRLIVRSQGTGRPRGLADLANWLFWEPAHWIMQTRQFANLKRRAERTRPTAASEAAAATRAAEHRS
jgi:hypothetical protein